MANAPQEKSGASVRVLEVRLENTLVGTLTRLDSATTLFVFNPNYVEDRNRPTLSLGFKDRFGGLVEDIGATRMKLHPFFSNLLPEGHLRQYLADRGGVHPDREFFLLWLLGTDLPGAVEVIADDGLPPRIDEDDHHDGVDAGHPQSNQPLRFSLAGVQLKFSAINEATSGLTLPVGGSGGNWIAKLPSTRFPSVPQNEYAMLTLAATVGIEIPEVRLVETHEIGNLPLNLPEAFGQSLAVRRFDRPEPGRRIHVEDFAQVFNVYPHDKYERANYANLAQVIWREAGEVAVTEFIRRLAFNVLIGNADAHLKNWSLIYPDRQHAQLAPAYDFVSTIAYIPNGSLALNLGDTKEFASINLARFRRLAEKAEISTRLVLKTAQDTAQALRDHWHTHEPVRQLPKKIREAIEKHMNTVPLGLGAPTQR